MAIISRVAARREHDQAGVVVGTLEVVEVDVGPMQAARALQVRVQEGDLVRRSAHVLVPEGHTFIMMRDDTIDLVKRFLGTGTIPPAQVATGRCPARIRTPS